MSTNSICVRTEIGRKFDVLTIKPRTANRRRAVTPTRIVQCETSLPSIKTPGKVRSCTPRMQTERSNLDITIELEKSLNEVKRRKCGRSQFPGFV